MQGVHVRAAGEVLLDLGELEQPQQPQHAHEPEGAEDPQRVGRLVLVGGGVHHLRKDDVEEDVDELERYGGEAVDDEPSPEVRVADEAAVENEAVALDVGRVEDETDVDDEADRDRRLKVEPRAPRVVVHAEAEGHRDA